MRKILICEADEAIRNMYKSSFEMYDYKVETVKSGVEFLNKAPNGIFDVILMSILLPDANGIDLLKNLKTLDARNVPVYILSSLDDTDTAMKLEGLNIKGYYVKAKTDPQRIVSDIDAYLDEKEKKMQ